MVLNVFWVLNKIAQQKILFYIFLEGTVGCYLLKMSISNAIFGGYQSQHKEDEETKSMRKTFTVVSFL